MWSMITSTCSGSYIPKPLVNMREIFFWQFFCSFAWLYFTAQYVQAHFDSPSWQGNIPPIPYNPYITWPLTFFNRPQYFANPPVYASHPSIMGILEYDDYKWNNFYNWSTTTTTPEPPYTTKKPDPYSYQQFVQSLSGYYGETGSPAPAPGTAMPSTRPSTAFPPSPVTTPTTKLAFTGLPVGFPIPPQNVVKDFNASMPAAENAQCSCYPFCIVEKDCADQQVVSIQVGNSSDGRACFATEGRMPHGAKRGVCVYTDDVRTRCIEDDKEKCLTFHRCCVDPQFSMRNDMST